jgi:hypothetical protein
VSGLLLGDLSLGRLEDSAFFFTVYRGRTVSVYLRLTWAPYIIIRPSYTFVQAYESILTFAHCRERGGGGALKGAI